ncbi:Methyl-accepting chemotaxis protein I serine chemoreceptor protein [Paraburkholderia caribensis MBA4]|uniref:Methyl-accepting chemotaxis protein I serine chemoreceptor protein n=1 Tax=Paraburkholderia caribensis MBA4 TaxID=1323664 RepID=A0A0P0RIC2_9BURK|nr:methyl-accepting chemotaxis protein [Paraburkholderia caribensis]ALL68513.1 Methyl-accepting chemotaxis protein I serine chemoreceptor protein [Paraburkholderia caribensis MBA4]
MDFIGRSSIGRRLGAGFTVVLLLLGAVGAVGLVQSSFIYSGTLEIADKWLPSVEALGSLRHSSETVRRLITRQLVSDDPNGAKAARAHHQDALTAFDEAFDAYSKRASSQEEQRLSIDIKEAWGAYLEIDSKIEALLDSGDAGLAEARSLSATEATTRFNKVSAVINQHIKLNRDGADQAAAAAKASFAKARDWTLALVAVAIAVGIAVAIAITRSITRPLQRSVEIAETVARGDLSAAIEVAGSDELSKLLFALHHMNERLVDMVSRVLSTSESIATASAQIAAGNTDLSQRTEEQAASLEQTAASMEELTATVKQNAGNASEGNLLASRALETATRGESVVSRAVRTMTDIATSSQKVAQIIAVIEGIAFQTNILALNAAVEAARAGEQGRGFAVVAAEVRTLAQRSASAAKDIKELIQQSVDRVDTGSESVSEAGRTMAEIMQSVNQVSALMQEISSASTEQQTGIEQVNAAVLQMDETTQQNAALVEEASAAAQSLASQSATLRQLMTIFTLPQTGQTAIKKHLPMADGYSSAKIPPQSPSHRKLPNYGDSKRRDPAIADTTAPHQEWEVF